MGARRRRRGMSLVEVMVVIAIVLTLMSIVAIGVMSIWQQSRVDTTLLTLARVGQDLQVWTLRHERAPTMDEGLAVLGEKVPADAWSRPIGYLTPGRDGASYALVSYGRDGEEGGTDLDEDLFWSPEDR